MDRRRAQRASCAGALALALLAAPPAKAAPDPLGALGALVEGGFAALGDLIGGSGLLTAALLGTAGDLIGLVDHNPVTRHVLFGIASRPTQALALGVSNGATGLLEGLRAEDIERLPQPAQAYLDTAPTAGRFDTALSGVGAIFLAPGDLIAAPLRAGLLLVGAGGTAAAVERSRTEARIRRLGPEPAADPGDSGTLSE